MLWLPNSLQIGPRPVAGGGGAGDIPELLDSFGVSWYGGFRQGLNQFASYADQLTPAVTPGNSVGQWAPSWTAGGFSAKFVQTTNSKRPSYMNWYGRTGILGDATTVWLNLDSTTDLNRDHTVLLAAAVPAASNTSVYSHSGSRMRFQAMTSSTNPTSPPIWADNVVGMSVTSALSSFPIDATTAGYRVGWRSVGTGFYNNAPNLLRLSTGSGYSESLITEVWLIGQHLTADQIAQCLPFLTL